MEIAFTILKGLIVLTLIFPVVVGLALYSDELSELTKYKEKNLLWRIYWGWWPYVAISTSLAVIVVGAICVAAYIIGTLF